MPRLIGDEQLRCSFSVHVLIPREPRVQYAYILYAFLHANYMWIYMRIASEMYANSNAKHMSLCVKFARDLHRICNFMFVRFERTTHWGRVWVHILVNNSAFGNTFSLQNTCLCAYFWFTWSSLCKCVHLIFEQLWNQRQIRLNTMSRAISDGSLCRSLRIFTALKISVKQDGMSRLIGNRRQSRKIANLKLADMKIADQIWYFDGIKVYETIVETRIEKMNTTHTYSRCQIIKKLCYVAIKSANEIRFLHQITEMIKHYNIIPVSYTHLTLPTIYSV